MKRAVRLALSAIIKLSVASGTVFMTLADMAADARDRLDLEGRP